MGRAGCAGLRQRLVLMWGQVSGTVTGTKVASNTGAEWGAWSQMLTLNPRLEVD